MKASKLLPRPAWRLPAATLLAGCMLLLSACGSTGPASPSGSRASSGSSLEVFGVIDVGVSHSSSQSRR